MTGKSYLPSKDADLQQWATNFITVANANLTALGLIAADMTGVSADKTSLDASITNNMTKQAEARAASEAKRVSRKRFEATVRLIVRKIQANPNVTPQMKAQLGITVKDPTPTPTHPNPPKDLLAYPNANGTNKLVWNRNNNLFGTIFIIETKDNIDNNWKFVGNTTKVNFEHNNQLPGKTQYYRVRAQRSDIISEPSNETVVYPNIS